MHVFLCGTIKVEEMNDIIISKGSLYELNKYEGFPYLEYAKNNNLPANIHSLASYILAGTWNTWNTGWVNRNRDWLTKVSKGSSITVIHSVITKYSNDLLADTYLTESYEPFKTIDKYGEEKGCKYCQEPYEFIIGMDNNVDDDCAEAYIERGNLLSVGGYCIDGGARDETEINFCPMCGSPLKKEKES